MGEGGDGEVIAGGAGPLDVPLHHVDQEEGDGFIALDSTRPPTFTRGQKTVKGEVNYTTYPGRAMLVRNLPPASPQLIMVPNL